MAEMQNEVLIKFLTEYEERFAAMVGEIEQIKARLDGMDAISPEETKKKNEVIEKLETSVHEIQENHARSGQQFSQLEKRVETVKTDSSAGVVISIVIFSLLFIVSLFIRS